MPPSCPWNKLTVPLKNQDSKTPGPECWRAIFDPAFSPKNHWTLLGIYRGGWLCFSRGSAISEPPVTWDPMVLREKNPYSRSIVFIGFFIIPQDIPGKYLLNFGVFRGMYPGSHTFSEKRRESARCFLKHNGPFLVSGCTKCLLGGSSQLVSG